jgi:hypothetical protein
MQMRWYKSEKYNWYWDSRNDSWYMSCPFEEYKLQFRERPDDAWNDISHIVERVIPPKPKD